MLSIGSLFRQRRRRRRVTPAWARRRRRTVRFERLESRELLAADLTLTEFMASNDATLVDGDGASPDWIEIHNAATEPVGLAGWKLTDDAGNLDKWEFPPLTLDPDQYLVVFASGNDRRTDASSLHTNFKLAADGEYLALVSPTGTVVSEFGPDGSDFPPQHADISYGVTPAGDRYFTEPTPGAANGAGYMGFVSAVDFSVERGFFETPFTVVLTTATPAATIRYTTDGSTPNENHGTVYSEPIPISATTTLRAAAFGADLIRSATETNTYLFVDDILQQSPTGEAPPGFPPELIHPRPENGLRHGSGCRQRSGVGTAAGRGIDGRPDVFDRD